MYKERYLLNREKLLKDVSINHKNRKVIGEFLVFEEHRLKRRNGLAEVDERSYKTLSYYLGRLKRLNQWFNNTPFEDLTEKEIEKLIDDLEDGKIKTRRGTRYADRDLYYQLMFGELFRIVDKDDIARDYLRKFSIKGRQNNNMVRYIDETAFRKIVDCAMNPVQKCLLWLAFDIGENISSLLELEKKDFKKQINQDTNEPEYLVFLSKEKLKRSRTPRSETTNYQDTVSFLDIVLANVKPLKKKLYTNKFVVGLDLNKLHPENRLFKFTYKPAEYFLKRAVKKAGVRVLPEGQEVVWKDLRSSMACDLLRKGWSRDEVNARLGHKPSSRIIDNYINYLSLDRAKPQKKVYESNIKKLTADLEQQKESNKLQGIKLENVKTDIEDMKKNLVKEIRANIMKELTENFKKEILADLEK